MSAIADALPGLPRDDGGPVFREPWEAQAFALALALHERGLYTWPEWAAALGRELAAAGALGSGDGGDYYRHWLSALEKLVAAAGACTGAELVRYEQAWGRAAGRTPHGQPIELLAGDLES